MKYIQYTIIENVIYFFFKIIIIEKIKMKRKLLIILPHFAYFMFENRKQLFPVLNLLLTLPITVKSIFCPLTKFLYLFLSRQI